MRFSKQLDRLGEPSTSKLHIYPLTAEFTELGDAVTVISSEFNSVSHDSEIDDKSLLASAKWQATAISEEPIISHLSISGEYGTSRGSEYYARECCCGE
jgi:hypothetical protein